MTGARTVVAVYDFPRLAVLPSPESSYANFYYLSQVAGQDGQFVIATKSHWCGTDDRLCYVVSIADVRMSLQTDRESVKMSVPRVQLVTNALAHGALSEDFLCTISPL